MSPLAKIFAASTDPALAESGGAHNQNGLDFQRYRAILRALTLEQEGTTDFVLLFESVQDALELDSEHDPSRARVYQVKRRIRVNGSGKTLRLLRASYPQGRRDSTKETSTQESG
jgi:hypothetical protein